LGHVLTCGVWIKTLDITTAEAGFLLNLLGRYCIQEGFYTVAEEFLERAVAIWEQFSLQKRENIYGDLLETAICLAWAFYRQRKFVRAESCFKDVFYKSSQELGLEHPKTAEALSGYAEVLRLWRKDYELAEQLHVRALAKWEKIAGETSEKVAYALDNLSFVYYDKRNYHKAESLLKRSLAIREHLYGLDHYSIAKCFYHLANVYTTSHRYREAMRCHERLMILRKTTVSQHDPFYIETLISLAVYYRNNARPKAAEVVLARAWSLWKVIPKENTILARIFDLYSFVLIDLDRFSEAEVIVSLLLKLYDDSSLGKEDPMYIGFLTRKAALCGIQGKHEEAYRYQLAAFNLLCDLTDTSFV